MSLSTTKTVPFSNKAEQSILGAILIDSEIFADVQTKIKSDEFYHESNRAIFEAMQDLFIQSKSIDPVTVIDRLSSSDAFKSQAECQEYLKVVIESVPTSSNVNDYIKIVHDKFVLRRIIELCDEISGEAFSTSEDAESVLNAAQDRFFGLSDGKDTHDFRRIQDAISDALNHINELTTNPEAARGAPTGFSALDNFLLGMSPGDLVIVGARPGMGKTTFVMNVATQVAMKTGKTVCVFNLEMSSIQLATRMLSSEALIESGKLRSGKLDKSDYEKLGRASSMLAECNILIDDTTSTSVASIRSKLRKVRSEIGLVVVDYLQLMKCDRKIDSRVNEVAEISRGLKLLAKDMKVPIMCCAQLSRQSEGRNDKRPALSDLRDSGAIEQDADTVLFLYRDEYYDKGKNTTDDVSNTAEIIIAKNRQGQQGTVKMGWLGKFTKFTTLDENAQEQ